MSQEEAKMMNEVGTFCLSRGEGTKTTRYKKRLKKQSNDLQNTTQVPEEMVSSSSSTSSTHRINYL